MKSIRFDFPVQRQHRQLSPLASSAMNGGASSLARSYARALSYFTRPWLHFTEARRRVPTRRQEYKKQKSQNEISARPSEPYKGFIVRHTRAPLHCMRIGAKTVLKDKKLSSWLERAKAGDFRYRFARAIFREESACFKHRLRSVIFSISITATGYVESCYIYMEYQNRCNARIYLKTGVRLVVLVMFFIFKGRQKIYLLI